MDMYKSRLEFNQVCVRASAALLGRCSNTDNVLLVPQAPPYTEEEAWTMYFKAEDAAWDARFAKEDVS